eukprot:265939-Prymnesium_polylepis.2
MKSNRKVIVYSFTGGCAAFFIIVLQIGWQKRHVLIHHANSTIPTVFISCVMAYLILRVRRILDQFGGFRTSEELRDADDMLVPAKTYLERVRQATAQQPMTLRRARGRSPSGRKRAVSLSSLRQRALSCDAASRRDGRHPADAKRKRKGKGYEYLPTAVASPASAEPPSTSSVMLETTIPRSDDAAASNAPTVPPLALPPRTPATDDGVAASSPAPPPGAGSGSRCSDVI